MSTLISSETLTPLDQYMTTYGVPSKYKSSLDEASKYEHIVVFDDRSSTIQGESRVTLMGTAKKIMEFAFLSNSEISVYFFNNLEVKTFTSFEGFSADLTERTPSDAMPLLETLDRVLEQRTSNPTEKKVIVTVLTAGLLDAGVEAIAKWFADHIAVDGAYFEKAAFSFQPHVSMDLSSYKESLEGLEGVHVSIIGTYEQEKEKAEAHKVEGSDFEYTEGEDLVKRLTDAMKKEADVLEVDAIQVQEENKKPIAACCIVS